MRTKILFLSPVRYPTEKAYGVTTGNTVKALSQLGCEVEIWSPNNFGVDEYGNLLVPVTKRTILNRNIVYHLNLMRINQLFFHLDELIFSIRGLIRIKYEKKNVFIWSRFPIVLFLCCLNKKVIGLILELHHQPNKISRIFIKALGAIKPLEIAMISKSALLKLKSSGLNVPTFVAEMAVPENFLASSDVPLESPIKICYLGKGKSSGNDNNLDFIVKSFLAVESLKKITLELVGLEKNSIDQLRNSYPTLFSQNKNLVFLSQMSHMEIGAYLDKVSIGLVPYELNPYNASRFPIKIVEYASKGIWILAPDDFSSNLEIPPGILMTYKAKDVHDFARKILVLADQVARTHKRNSEAINFAKQHTYARRAEKIKDAFSRLSFEKQF